MVGKILEIGSVTLSTALLLGGNGLASEVFAEGITATPGMTLLDSSIHSLERVDRDFAETDVLEQVTSVSQLADVNPTDWAYQALQALNHHYNCLVGYPNGTFQGDRSLNRFEFAAGLSACLGQIEALIAASTAETVSRQDWAILERLQSEFAAELFTLRGQIDDLEARIASLEAQQSSTTTQLSGEAIFGLIDVSGGEKADESDDPVAGNLTFGNRVRLGLNTSFTGEDLLFVRFQARNFPNLQEATGTPMARLGFDGNTEDQIEIDTLKYTLPVGEQVVVHINAQANAEDFVDTINPLLDSGGRGAISRFGRRNPIYRQIGSRGVGLNYSLNEQVSLGVGYLANQAGDETSGLFNGPYGAIAQVIVRPNEDIDLGLTYIHAYNTLETDTGSLLSNDPFDDESEAIKVNSFGLGGDIRLSSTFSIGGWVGYTTAVAEDLSDNPNAEIFNYAITLAFPDLGGEGNLAGLVVGQPPKVTSNDLGSDFTDPDTSLHLEAFYRWQATDNIFITPGIFVITNPNHDANNDTIYLAVVRTTFRF